MENFIFCAVSNPGMFNGNLELYHSGVSLLKKLSEERKFNRNYFRD